VSPCHGFRCLSEFAEFWCECREMGRRDPNDGIGWRVGGRIGRHPLSGDAQVRCNRASSSACFRLARNSSSWAVGSDISDQSRNARYFRCIPANLPAAVGAYIDAGSAGIVLWAAMHIETLSVRRAGYANARGGASAAGRGNRGPSSSQPLRMGQHVSVRAARHPTIGNTCCSFWKRTRL